MLSVRLLIIFLLLAGLAPPFVCLLSEITKDIPLKILSIESNLLTEVSVYTGRHSKPILYHMDFNFNKVVIPAILRESAQPQSVFLFNFLDCACKLCCKLVDQEDNLVMYKDRLLWLKKTKLFFSFDYFDFLDYDKLRKSKVYLSEKGLPSTRNRALLGMGVGSPFWAHFIQHMLENKLEHLFVVFNYKSALDSFDRINFDPDRNEESVYTSLRITSELHRQDDLRFLAPLPKNGLIFGGALESKEMDFRVDNIQVCLDNTALSFMIFKEKLHFLAHLRRLVCENPRVCTRKEDIVSSSGKLEVTVRMPAIDNDRQVVLVVHIKELFSIDAQGMIQWNFKEFNDFLDNQDADSSVPEDLRYIRHQNKIQNEMNEGITGQKNSWVEQDDKPEPVIEKDHERLKYDYYESLEQVYQELGEKEKKYSLDDQQNKSNCDVLLGARFMFKYNIVFRIVKKNDYPLEFELGLAFNENKKYVQDWKVGFCYLGASLLIAVVIIFVLRNKKDKRGSVPKPLVKQPTSKLKTD